MQRMQCTPLHSKSVSKRLANHNDGPMRWRRCVYICQRQGLIKWFAHLFGCGKTLVEAPHWLQVDPLYEHLQQGPSFGPLSLSDIEICFFSPHPTRKHEFWTVLYCYHLNINTWANNCNQPIECSCLLILLLQKCNNHSTPQSIYSSSNLVILYSTRDALLVKLRRKNKSTQIF